MKKLAGCIILISLAVFFIFSCKKDKTSLTSVDESSSGSSVRTTVTGIVLDESNAPLNGVTVTAHGQTATTNQYGTFVLKNLSVNKDRCVLQFAKAGFFKRLHGFIAAENTVNYVRIVLTSNAASQSFSSSTGGTVSLPDGSSVLFQPSSFVTSNGNAYNGTVNIAIKHLSPDDVNFGFTIPGGDLLGKDLNNKDVALYTYGMLGVELTGSSGEALQLAAGTSATLTFSIAASQLSSAPATIPLWYFDETTSLWKEEGSANKVNNTYVGDVKHFSWWNCDYFGPRSYLHGKVVDCNIIPIANAVVSLNGDAECITDQNGEYNTWIPSGLTQQIQMQVLAISNNGFILSSQPENIPSLSPGQTVIVPDLVIPCITRVIGNIKTCTGDATDGFVSLTKANSFTYQYTVNGSFNLPAPDNSQEVLYAINSFHSFSQIITTLAAPNNLNVGNLLLCDSIMINANSISINAGPLHQQFNITPTTATGTVNYATHQTNIHVVGDSPPYHFNFLDFSIYGDTVGSYSAGNVEIDIYNGTQFYFTFWNSGNENYVITQIDSIGGRIKGYYTMDCYLEGTTNNYNGIASGFFDVVRTQ